MKGCTYEDCTHPLNALGLCYAHWSQQRRTGHTWPLWSRSQRGGDVVEECELLACAGSPDVIAARLGFGSKDSLYRALHRAKRLDLWRRMQGSPAAVRTYSKAV